MQVGTLPPIALCSRPLPTPSVQRVEVLWPSPRQCHLHSNQEVVLSQPKKVPPTYGCLIPQLTFTRFAIRPCSVGVAVGKGHNGWHADSWLSDVVVGNKRGTGVVYFCLFCGWRISFKDGEGRIYLGMASCSISKLQKLVKKWRRQSIADPNSTASMTIRALQNDSIISDALSMRGYWPRCLGLVFSNKYGGEVHYFACKKKNCEPYQESGEIGHPPFLDGCLPNLYFGTANLCKENVFFYVVE